MPRPRVCKCSICFAFPHNADKKSPTRHERQADARVAIHAARRRCVAAHSDTNPAKAGSIVQVFATGFGSLSPFPPDGQVVNEPLPSLLRPLEVNVWQPYSDIPLEVVYAGPAPTLAAGAIQVNFRLPAQPLKVPEPQFIFTVDGWQSEPFVILAQ